MVHPFTITIFGAESTGKTTLSRQLADALNGEWVCEFARPYLETTGQDVTTQSMYAIWRGQADVQRQKQRSLHRYIIQDTDLFSTVGYWQLPHVEPAIGQCPTALIADASNLQSDLYLITQSNIPFEPDRLRYGGDTRESPDTYWIDICKQYGLPHVVLESSDRNERITEALRTINERSTACVA